MYIVGYGAAGLHVWCTVFIINWHIFLVELLIRTHSRAFQTSKSKLPYNSAITIQRQVVFIERGPITQRTKLPRKKASELKIGIPHKAARVSPINTKQTAHQLI